MGSDAEEGTGLRMSAAVKKIQDIHCQRKQIHAATPTVTGPNKGARFGAHIIVTIVYRVKECVTHIYFSTNVKSKFRTLHEIKWSIENPMGPESLTIHPRII